MTIKEEDKIAGDLFKKEYIELCKKHELVIGDWDGHGKGIYDLHDVDIELINKLEYIDMPFAE